MSQRSFLYSLLKNDVVLQGHVLDRIYQGSSMRTARVKKPYIVYHIGNETDEGLSELTQASRRFFQVYIHDDIGDFTKVDIIGKRVRDLLLGQGSPPDKIITTRFLERSQDLEDQTLNTIFNYLRFQWVLSS